MSVVAMPVSIGMARCLTCILPDVCSLYANISCIRWDYKSSHVKGWITSAGR